MSTVQLPDGNSAELREADSLSNRDVKDLRRIARKVSVVGQKLRDLGIEEITEDSDEADTSRKTLDILSKLTDSEDDALDLFQRHCLVMRLTSWTLRNPDGTERPLPKTVEEVDDLPRPIYAKLTTAAAELDLNEDFSMDGAADPKVPTENSDA